ncbi:MAG: hypothetical protein ACE5GS_12120 [Kiloniellaceae bacterium]
MRKLGAIILLVFALATPPAARGGHETPIYPSYYPQEIRIETVDAVSAAQFLRESKIHAYVGGEPSFSSALPDSIGYVESLGSYVVLTLDPTSPLARDEAAGCTLAKTVIRGLGEGGEGFVFHPYPVTPYHADYLNHFDLAAAAKTRILNGSVAAMAEPKVRATGALADKLVPPRWRTDGPESDARIEEIDVGGLVAGVRFFLNGWSGPPWLKEGWFHAYLLLAGALSGDGEKSLARALFQRLRRGDYRKAEERITLERDLVSLLTGGCAKVVVGYTTKREYFSSEYSAGIENIAYDSHAGLNSAIFIRTVKLKDFPWNGWLRLGIGTEPSAAWNPMGGFSDEAGRLIWSALGDPALFPEPYNAGWTLNRIGDVRSTAGW